MLQRLKESDWEEAFRCAGLDREDVVTIEGVREGENDGASWLCFGTLVSGTWFILSAWCDYTGWG